LFARHRLGKDVFQRGAPEGMRTVRHTEHTATIYDLLKAYADQRAKTVKQVHVVARRTVWSIKDARTRLEGLVGKWGGDWVQLDLFLEQFVPSIEVQRTALASSFGATLEMAREGVIELYQDVPFGPLRIRPKVNAGEVVTRPTLDGFGRSSS